MPPVVHHVKVRVVPRHPFRRRPVRRQHHVQPHRQAVPGREVEHRVVVVEVVDVPRRFHPVPVRRAAHDPEARRTDVGKVLVPAIGFRSAPAIVLDPNGERGVRVSESGCHASSPIR